MIKLLLVIIIVFGVGFVAYNQGLKNTPEPEVISDIEDGETTEYDSHTATPIEQPSEPAVEVSPTAIQDRSNSGLVQVPMNVFSRRETEVLDLSNNQLTGSLPAEIRFLQNLRVLDVSNNQFTGVPAEIGQLKNLEVLDLSNNKITGLPLELGNLSNLQRLNLTGNAYSVYDLGLIQESLPAGVVIEVD